MKTILLNIAALLLFYTASSQSNSATVREYAKTFKTYDFSDPDPIARVGAIYPYYRFDGYSDTPVNKKWKVVELENEFIRLMILPEVGGKIWGAWEKSSGKPFIYYNQVVKFRDVAMRGPWTSGGIEANYGIIGHTPNCATPVDYLTEKKADGSTSCYIGTLDLLTQTYWTIEINLPPDKAYFTTRSYWHNSTPLEQPYYTWMNTGLKAAGNLEFIYPGNRYLGHSGEYADWKINRENGKNISFYEENNFGEYKSYHVFGSYTDFFGAYWHDDDYGMGRYSTHDDKPGKKIWIWGLSQQGMIWEKLLTDTDGQYVEVQSGRLFNQASEGSTFTPFKNLGFAPAVSDTWTEYWFPVMNTGGFVKANAFGALNLRNGNGYLKINFSPLQKVVDDLNVFEGTKLIYSKKLNLMPLKPFSDSLAYSGNAENITVKLGENKLQYRSNPSSEYLSRPVTSPQDFDWNSMYGLYLQGKDNIQRRYYPQAEEKLLACLAKDANYVPALTDMAMLMFMKMEFQKSLDYSMRALSINTYDPAGNFYYGLANLELGNVTDAKDGFDIASLSPDYRAAAYSQLSKIYCRENDFVKALHYADKSLEVNAANTDAYQTKALVHRLLNDPEKAKANLFELNRLNPLAHFIRFEQFRLDPTDLNKIKFTSLIRNEMPKETYLQLADWYFTAGQLNEALNVLSLAPPDPEVYYWIAYLKQKAGAADASEFIQKANRLSPALVFPFRSSTAKVLSWVSTQSDHWAPKYYLGLIYWSRNDKVRAKQLFAACGSPDFAPFYAARTALLDGENASSDLMKASQLEPNQWRYGRSLTNYFIETKRYPEALARARELHKQFPNDFKISMLLARTLLLNRQYKASTDLLSQINVLPAEGSTDGRQLFREAWLMQAIQQLQTKNYKAALNSMNMAKLWPENLGAGKPYEEDIDSRLDNYLLGVYYERTKAPDKASQQWQAVTSYKSNRNNINTLVTAFALKKLNRGEEGKELLAQWARTEPESKLARWSNQLYNGTNGDADFEGNESYRLIMEFLSKS
jgi:Tfp pilus assembly protein PilF